ncbi:MAG: hypothetical protein WD042_07680 [Phycisphaeraceae bacterium]
MSRLMTGLAVLIFAALAAAQTTQPGAPDAALPGTPGGDGAAEPWERYDVVVQRNIFTRVHSSGRTSRRVVTPPAPELPAARYWVLSGTALTSDERVAFLENTRTGATVRAHEGDATEAGRITQVDRDSIELDANGQRSTVAIGLTLDGREPLTTAPTAAPATVPTMPAAATSPASVPGSSDGLEESPVATQAAPTTNPAAPPGDSSEAEMLRRMRERRNQETQGR